MHEDRVSDYVVRRVLTKLYSLPSHFPLILQVRVVADGMDICMACGRRVGYVLSFRLIL